MNILRKPNSLIANYGMPRGTFAQVIVITSKHGTMIFLPIANFKENWPEKHA